MSSRTCLLNNKHRTDFIPVFFLDVAGSTTTKKWTFAFDLWHGHCDLTPNSTMENANRAFKNICSEGNMLPFLEMNQTALHSGFLISMSVFRAYLLKLKNRLVAQLHRWTTDNDSPTIWCWMGSQVLQKFQIKHFLFFFFVVCLFCRGLGFWFFVGLWGFVCLFCCSVFSISKQSWKIQISKATYPRKQIRRQKHFIQDKIQIWCVRQTESTNLKTRLPSVN